MIVLGRRAGKTLTKFEAIGPDLVILDIMMPDMDGYLTCSESARFRGSKRVPILVPTGLDDAQSIGRAYQHGATDFITKPVNADHSLPPCPFLCFAPITCCALIRSESRLELAQRIARIGNWDWNRDDHFAVSNELCRGRSRGLQDLPVPSRRSSPVTATARS